MMTAVVPLENLGRRICIFGPICAGKSTLAAALGQKIDALVIYLDCPYHQPDADWVPRSPRRIRYTTPIRHRRRKLGY